jgi:beta-galactosidase
MNNQKQTSSLSRREFTRRCAIGSLTLAASSIFNLAIAQKGPARIEFPLDQEWLFGGKLDSASSMDETAFAKVNLPHCVTKLSWEKWDPASWESVWLYRRHFSLPYETAGQRVFIKFDGAMTSATPKINGVALPEHFGGYLPFEYELTKFLKDGDNILDVEVDARWQDVPPDGNPKGPRSVDYLQPGGIVRPVRLCIVPQVFISDVFAKPLNVLSGSRSVAAKCTVNATEPAAQSYRIKVKLMDGDHVVSSAQKTVAIEKEGDTEVEINLTSLGNIKLWDVDAPHLYQVVTTLLLDGKPVHDHRCRIGFREAHFTEDGVFLNGRRLQLFGLDRHELFPYVGGAMPPRVMRRDAEILRREFNCNIVRCSHYPQSEAFLDACDELGLMVWQETPGWGYIGDALFEERVVQNVTDMIRRDRNHPAVVIWGTRVNESRNDQPLYRRTTEIARTLDGSRPTSGSMTSGSRKRWRTEWHQDVFAFDDYDSAPDGSVDIEGPTLGVPYMLAEVVGGFSYGKKGFNNKYRRAGDVDLQVSQAIFHAEAHDRCARTKANSGAIGWCAFDYGSLMNSFKAVKCPGVADVFRIPKLGAAFYQAQVDPKIRAVIVPDFYWDFGAKRPGGPGKHAAIFSNCERLEIFIDGKHTGTAHPDRVSFPHLKYPPFFCDLEAGGSYCPELRIDGYVGDAKLLSKSFSSNVAHDQLFLAADDKELMADGADVTRVVFKVADQFGSERAFAGGTVAFELTGPGIIVGDQPFDLTDSGGVGAIWVKTIPNRAGLITLTATHSSLGKKTVEINVQPA